MRSCFTPPGILRCLVLGLAALATPSAVAAPDRGTLPSGASATGIELIGFEASGCIYCPILRHEMQAGYATSRAGKTAPLRFIDVNDEAAEGFTLISPITIVPTLVLMRDGMEIGRIAGYVGRESVHRILAGMLPD